MLSDAPVFRHCGKIVTAERACAANPQAHCVEDLPAVVYAFLATRAFHARARATGHVELVQIYPNSLDFEKPLVLKLSIGEYLPLFTTLNLCVERVRQSSGFVEGQKPHSGIIRKVQEGRRDFTIVQIFETSLSQPNARH